MRIVIIEVVGRELGLCWRIYVSGMECCMLETDSFEGVRMWLGLGDGFP